MATPSGQLRPGRYLALFALIVVALYALVFFTGDREPTPKLGIDLKGGTRVTLTAKTPDGSEPTQESLQQARQIIQQRVNSTGVSGANVVTEGTQIVITVPGKSGDQAKQLGQTAKLSFRKVVNSTRAGLPQTGTPSEQPSGAPSGSQQPSATGAADSSPTGGGGGAAGVPAQGGATPTQDPDGTGDDGAAGNDGAAGDDAEGESATDIEKARQLRQNPALVPGPEAGQQAQAQARQLQQQALSSLDCSASDVLRGNAVDDRPLVTCSRDGTSKYVLGPVFLPGEQISDASTVPPGQRRSNWAVNLQFESQGSGTWADFTSANVGEQAAFVLDSRVVSAPRIETALLDGSALITGNFSKSESEDLAEVLKYGALPLSFEQSDAKTVSATLGLASLQAGLIAGAVGIVLVFIYSLFYYRILGVLTVLSLILSATIVYGVLVLLGRWIGFTLDLAGVAGFIIAIGVTADSFVVYFERLKDEIREGKTFRSAVSRGWVRARRTILASDTILFLASAVLYILAVGDVKGFAFTLGMSTVLDLSVVFLVTHPLVAKVARTKKLSSPTLSGLGAVQRLGESRRSARKVGGVAAKEA